MATIGAPQTISACSALQDRASTQVCVYDSFDAARKTLLCSSGLSRSGRGKVRLDVCGNKENQFDASNPLSTGGDPRVWSLPGTPRKSAFLAPVPATEPRQSGEDYIFLDEQTCIRRSTLGGQPSVRERVVRFQSGMQGQSQATCAAGSRGFVPLLDVHGSSCIRDHAARLRSEDERTRAPSQSRVPAPTSLLAAEAGPTASSRGGGVVVEGGGGRLQPEPRVAQPRPSPARLAPWIPAVVDKRRGADRSCSPLWRVVPGAPQSPALREHSATLYANHVHRRSLPCPSSPQLHRPAAAVLRWGSLQLQVAPGRQDPKLLCQSASSSSSAETGNVVIAAESACPRSMSLSRALQLAESRWARKEKATSPSSCGKEESQTERRDMPDNAGMETLMRELTEACASLEEELALTRLEHKHMVEGLCEAHAAELRCASSAHAEALAQRDQEVHIAQQEAQRERSASRQRAAEVAEACQRELLGALGAVTALQDVAARGRRGMVV